MSEPFRFSLNPRYYECDPDGWLQPASYVRFALQAALEAGAAADLPGQALEPAQWLEHVGDIGLQISQPIKFGQPCEIRTRLAQPGPPAWRRSFDFQQADRTVARAFVDLFDGDDNDSDADISDQSSDDAPATWDGPVPEPPAAPRRAFRAVWRAGWQHMDISGQLDPAWLTQALGDMDRRAAEAAGWSAEREGEAGILWQVIEHRLEVFDPVAAGDELKITTYLGAADDDQIVRHALIERQDDGVAVEVARGRTRWACLSTANLERCPMPDDWLYDLADQMAEL